MTASPAAVPSSGAPSAAPARAGGPRQAAAIHAAVLAQLAEHGYAAMTIEAVARAAGVNKTTLYRWWPSKAALVGATFAHAVDGAFPVPDTGTLRDDLAALLHSKIDFFGTGPGRLAGDVLANVGSDPDLGQTAAALLRDNHAHIATVLDRARRRGEIVRAADPVVLADMLLGPVWFRVVVQRQPFTQADVATVVDVIADGLR